MPPHMFPGSMCSHRRRILCWDSSRPSVTIITPHGDFDKAGPRFDSLTCSLHGSRAKQKFMTRKAANLGKRVSVRAPAEEAARAGDQYETGDVLIIIGASDTELAVVFRAGRAPSAAACSASPLDWVSGSSRRN